MTTMVKISAEGFVRKLIDYHYKPDDSYENAMAVVEAMRATPRGSFEKNPCLRFGHNSCLVLKLLNRAYDLASSKGEFQEFSERTAQAIQKFAEPFPEEDNLAYPHFLLHGLEKPTVDDIISKIEHNGRIIHETIPRRPICGFEKPIDLERGLFAKLTWGDTDDYFGIALHLCTTYDDAFSMIPKTAAKLGFFLDRTNNEIYVINLQGQRVDRKNVNGVWKRNKEKGKEYARLTSKLGIDPRGFLLKWLCMYANEKEYTRIKVIRPTFHPMFIEQHKGFYATYEPVIKQSGITEENGCYLEASLSQNVVK